MMEVAHDELWRPRSGSWEEVVDTYDEQFHRYALRRRHERPMETPVEALRDHQAPATTLLLQA